MTSLSNAKFLAWETQTRDTVDFKKIYVDMAGDIFAGLVLSEIVYWHLPNSKGASRLRVKHNGVEWIACPRYEWWDRTRLSPRQLDRALAALIKSNIIVKKYFAFNGARTTHVRINWDAFIPLWDSLLNAPLENPYAPKNTRIEGSSNETVKTDDGDGSCNQTVTTELQNEGSSYQTVTTETSYHQTVTTATDQGELSPNGDSVVTKSATPITETTTETTKGSKRDPEPDAQKPRNRFDYYHAFEAGFPDYARIKINDNADNRRIAREIFDGKYTPQEVTDLVQSKLAQGKTSYRFRYLIEDLGQARLEKEKRAPAPTPKYHRADPELVAALEQVYRGIH